jgi:hypothetical protein
MEALGNRHQCQMGREGVPAVGWGSLPYFYFAVGVTMNQLAIGGPAPTALDAVVIPPRSAFSAAT